MVKIAVGLNAVHRVVADGDDQLQRVNRILPMLPITTIRRQRDLDRRRFRRESFRDKTIESNLCAFVENALLPNLRHLRRPRFELLGIEVELIAIYARVSTA